MKKTCILFSIFLLSLVSAYSQDTVIGNNNGNVYTIPEVEDGGSFDLFVKKGGLFPLKLANYQSGTVAWGIICNDPTIDTLKPHCGAGHYVVTYQKYNGNPSTLHLYIKYHLDIYSFDYDEGIYWLLPEGSIQLKSGPNFAVIGFKKVGADDNTIIGDSIYTVTEPGLYCAGALDAGGYTSSDTVTVAYSISPNCPASQITSNSIVFSGTEAGVSYTLLQKNGDILTPVSPTQNGGAASLTWSSLVTGTYKLKANTTKDNKTFEYMYNQEFVVNNDPNFINELNQHSISINHRNILISTQNRQHIKIISLTGITIFEKEVEGTQNLAIDVQPGIYIVQIQNNKANFIKKIVVE